MDLSLRGKRAVVCGSSQGIGKASALELAMLGADVTLLARDEGRLQGVLTELSRYPGRHDYKIADFSQPSQVQAQAQALAAQEAVHILVNNTGGPPPGQAIDADAEHFIKAFTAHLLCNQVLTQAFAPGMKKAGYGRIINIISTSVKMPIRGLGVSNTIRGAVANWAKTLSVELGPFGITVNNVLPGATRTGRFDAVLQGKVERTGKTAEALTEEMIHEIPAARIAAPEEVAAAVAFLASPAASYINGINLPVDGGRTGTL
jgi:3-oxoacyl-[acyl-carrier protein] reductase